MNLALKLAIAALVAILPARADGVLDRLDEALAWSDASGNWRAHASGLLDLEEYALPEPAPGVIDAGRTLFNPRLSTFVDARLGPTLYLFAQARADRGFDPAAAHLRVRLDEYALRWAPDRQGRFNLQVGAFATVVGNWTARHDSWTNPFITAPLPYENLTGVWDTEPPHSAAQLLTWAHVRPGLSPAIRAEDKYLRLPIIWGPSYGTGAAVAGELGRWRYALEMKNAALAARPQTWPLREQRWTYPTVSGRIRYVPNEAWEFGWSASSGRFLRPGADEYLTHGFGRGDYREIVVAQDVAYAWHHFQLWAEAFGARYHLPLVGNADTAAYYVEARYKFTPEFSAAVRWNEQLFGTLADRGAALRWGRNVRRIDFGPAYRFTPHMQVKAQYSVQQGNNDAAHPTQMAAVQATVRW